MCHVIPKETRCDFKQNITTFLITALEQFFLETLYGYAYFTELLKIFFKIFMIFSIDHIIKI